MSEACRHGYDKDVCVHCQETDGLDAALEDEIAAHQETLLLWNNAKAEIARMKDEFAGLNATYRLFSNDRRERIATACLQGLIAASYGQEGYVPGYSDADFVQDGTGSWHKTKYGWQANADGCDIEPKHRHRYASTVERRFSRDAIGYADALIAELGKPAETVKQE